MLPSPACPILFWEGEGGIAGVVLGRTCLGSRVCLC